MKLAHLHAAGHSWTAGADGAFRVELPPGFTLVRFTGVDHAAQWVGLFLDGAEVAVDVTLGTYAHDDKPLFPPGIVVSEPIPGGKPKVIAGGGLEPGPSGVQVAKVAKALPPEVFYEIRGLAKDHTVNGPEADRFEYDGDGDYFSVLHPANAKGVPFTVTLDPARVPPPGLAAHLAFADPQGHAARIAELYADAMRRLDDVAGSANGPWRADLARASAGLTDPKDADLLAATRIAMLIPPPAKGEEAASLARAALETPARSTLWRFRPEAAVDAVELAGSTPEREAYLDDLVTALDDPEASGKLLAARVRQAAHAGREDDLARLYKLLRERYPGTAGARSATAFDPARHVRPRLPLPDFDVPALAGSPLGARITRASLAGKVALIDFWGTWCLPCRGEVKYLEKAFAKHKGEGLVMISVAAHDQAAHVRAFRAGGSPMPWSHVVLDGKNQDAVLQRFEVRSFPTAILVDRSGRIVGMGDELRGEALEPAISAAISATSP